MVKTNERLGVSPILFGVYVSLVASLVAQLVKNLPAMQETWVQSLGWEDPLEKGKITHSSILAERIPWTIHEVTKSLTGLSDLHFHFLEKLDGKKKTGL